MTKRKLLRVLSFAALTVGLLTLAAGTILPLLLTNFTAFSPSVGIIGGADGPTAIVVATTTGIAWELIIGLVLAAAGIVGLAATRKKA